MHRGCFVWTPTPPLSGRRTPRPGPARVCVCVRCLAGSGVRASRARFGAPHLFLWPFLVGSLFVRPLPGRGCPVCGCCWVLLFFFVSLCFLSPSLPHCAPVESCFACFTAPGALGLGVLSPPPTRCAPPSPALCVFRPAVPWPLASCCPPPLFFAPPPPSLLSLVLYAFRLPAASAPPLPPFFFPLVSCFFFFRFFSPFFFLFPSFFAGCVVLGGFVCLGTSCVPRWCCPCRCSVCAGWCCVVLAAGPGCLLLSPGGSWCRASVVLSLSCCVARRPVVRRGVSWCSAALCCVLLRGAVVWWCAVVLCRLFASLPVPVVCFLPLRVCCVYSGVSCCVFPVLPVHCAVRVVCAVSGGWCCWFLVSLPFVGGLLVALVARRCRLVVCVGSGARVWSGRRWASSLWCPAPLCCVLWRCAAVWCCAVVPCLLFLFYSLLVALVSCCSPLVLGSGPVPGRFCFCALPVRCCAGVPASLLSVRCSLALAGLPGVLCCCLLCLCVCCSAWLCSVVSWWVLVAPDVVSRWRAVVCPGVLCCAVLLRVVPPGVAVLCAVLFRFAPFGAAARCVVSWGAVPPRGVVCLLAPCFVSTSLFAAVDKIKATGRGTELPL